MDHVDIDTIQPHEQAVMFINLAGSSDIHQVVVERDQLEQESVVRLLASWLAERLGDGTTLIGINPDSSIYFKHGRDIGAAIIYIRSIQ